MIPICLFSASLFLAAQSLAVGEPVGSRGADEMPVPMSKLYEAGVPKLRATTRPRNEQCSMECMRRMKEDIEKDEEFNQFILKQSKPYRFQSQFDENMLRKYCEKMNATIDCVNPCEGATVKTIALQALSLPKYMCVDTRFLEYSPCYARVSKKVERNCHSPSKCGNRKTELEAYMSSPPRDLDGINRLLVSTCQYISCFNECDRSDMIRDCGVDANNVLEGLYAKSMQVMKSMFVTMGFPIEMPAECNAIGDWSPATRNNEST